MTEIAVRKTADLFRNIIKGQHFSSFSIVQVSSMCGSVCHRMLVARMNHYTVAFHFSPLGQFFRQLLRQSNMILGHLSSSTLTVTCFWKTIATTTSCKTSSVIQKSGLRQLFLCAHHKCPEKALKRKLLPHNCWKKMSSAHVVACKLNLCAACAAVRQIDVCLTMGGQQAAVGRWTPKLFAARQS